MSLKKKLNIKKTLWKRPKGSLLIEALLAVVILSTSITIIIQSMTASLRASDASKSYSLALILLENNMYDLIQQGFIDSNLRKQGNFPEPYEQYKYELETTPYDGVEGNHLNTVNLKVSWVSGRKNNAIIVQSYLFNSPQNHE